MLILFLSDNDDMHDYIEENVKSHSILHAFSKEEAHTLLNMGDTRTDIFITTEPFIFHENDRVPIRTELCESTKALKHIINGLTQKPN